MIPQPKAAPITHSSRAVGRFGRPSTSRIEPYRRAMVLRRENPIASRKSKKIELSSNCAESKSKRFAMPRAARNASISEEANQATQVPNTASCSVLRVRSEEVESNAGNGDCSIKIRGPSGGGVELRNIAEFLVALLQHLVQRKSTQTCEVIA